MPTLRVASANIEWMNDWFVSGSGPAAFKPTFTKDGQTNNTKKTATRAADLLKAIDADIVGIQEGPSRQEELDLFINTYLSSGGTPIYQSILGDSGAAQKLGVLWKKGSVTSAGLAAHADITGLIDPWSTDVDGDMLLEHDYLFTRTPLVVNFTFNTHKLQMIVMHTKSSFVNQGKQLWTNLATRQQYVVEALKSRRRNGTEGMRLRSYLDAKLATDAKFRCVVVGDLNDGPGMDYFEVNYLAHNITDIIVGSAFEPEWLFDHCQHDVPAAQRFTAVFNDFVENINNKKLLLDHILLSPGLMGATGLRRVAGTGVIHHTEYDALIVSGGKKRQNRPSDHRPVSVQLTY